MKKMTLGFKLVAGGILVVLIPLLVIGIFAVVKASTSLEDVAKERAEKGAAKIADLVQEVLITELKVATEISLSGDAANAAAGVNTEVMDKRLTDELRIRAWVAEDPMSCVARGCGMILESYDSLRRLLVGLERGSTKHS